jgi:hypothetical protein
MALEWVDPDTSTAPDWDTAQVRRLVRVDFGAPKHPAVVYMAPPDVIARFTAALRKWNPEYTIEVEPIENPEDLDIPPPPTRRLWTWE